MKTLIIYTSQTGFTQKYAAWISNRMQGDLLTIKEAKKKDKKYFEQYDAIIYGGWAMAGSVVQSKWFIGKASGWRDKKLVLFCVGASPEANPDVEQNLHKLLTDDERKYIKVFYCQGGLDYSKMNMPSKLAMKTLVSVLKKKKNASQKDKDMANMIEHSYDISDEKFIDPIVEYLIGNESV